MEVSSVSPTEFVRGTFGLQIDRSTVLHLWIVCRFTVGDLDSPRVINVSAGDGRLWTT